MIEEDQSGAASETDYVYYSPGDYAGIGLRFIAMAVDLVVMIALWFLMAATILFAQFFFGRPENFDGTVFLAGLATGWCYWALLKRSRFRSPGYWLAGLKVVDLRGEKPSVFAMSIRFFSWAAGPINPIVDLFFVSNEEHRQTLHDKLIGTYVVKLHAKPAGYGRKTYVRWSFMGMMLILPEVQPCEQRA